MKIDKNKLNVVIDGQWGSTGKGKLYGWLYNRFPEINIAVCDFMPNAGHTYVDDEGKSFVSKILPVGILFDTVKFVLIGPHAVFDVDRLFDELGKAKQFTGDNNIQDKLRIHPLASVVTKEDAEKERSELNHVASTMQGSGQAVINKMRRNKENVKLARDIKELSPFIGDTYFIMNQLLGMAKSGEVGFTALAETAQGFDLGLNNGIVWPYVTSRDCMVGRVLDNAGVSPKKLGKVIASLRTFPIRVGNTEGGFSGPCYEDQEELSWSDISSRTGFDVVEYTTVTKRVRRVFTWSNEQTERFCTMCGPDYAFLNFVNYFTPEESKFAIRGIHDLLGKFGCELSLLGTGPKLSDYQMR